MSNLKWEQYGNYSALPKSKIFTESAVYRYTFKGNAERVIYVGTAKNLHKRLLTHKAHLNKGGHTIFNVMKDGQELDIYDLMKKPFDYYKTEEGKRQVWIPHGLSGTHELDHKINYYKKDHLNFSWESYMIDFYLKNIHIEFTPCPIDELKNLETKLQLEIIKKDKITYYVKHPQRSWIGKIEKGKILSSHFKDL